MQHLFHLAATDVESIFWIVVVVITVAVKAIKAASKKAARGNPAQPARATPAVPDRQTAATEIRDFIESLTRGQPAPIPPAPVAAPPAPKPRRKPAKPPRAKTSPAPQPPPHPAVTGMPVAETALVQKEAVTAFQPEMLVRELRAGPSVRKAILLKEILGPPIGLRT